MNNKTRNIILAASVLIQLVLGSVYAWSTIAAALQSQIHFTSFQTQSIFGGVILVFSFSLIIGGRLFRKFGPRFTATISGVLFLIGFILASSTNSYIPLTFFISGIVGIAIGLGYACPLSTGVAWFPNHKGLITGVALFGFGAGSIFANWFFTSALNVNLTTSQLFFYLGLVGGIIVIIAAQFLKLPHTYATSLNKHIKTQSIKGLVKNPEYWKLVIGLSCGSFSGLLIIGKVAGITMDMGFGVSVNSSAPILAVSLAALGNSVGRLFWGWFDDKYSKVSIPLTLLLTGLTSFLLIGSNSSLEWYLFLIFATGLLFGGSLVLYAAHTERTFGTGSLATTYPWIFISYGIGALLGSSLGGYLYDFTGTPYSTLILAGILPLTGFIAIWILNRTQETKALPAES